jgi:hypothetical protein
MAIPPPLPSSSHVAGDSGHPADHDLIVEALQVALYANSVTPATATYDAALGDRAGITLGTTTSAIVPAASGWGVQEIVIGAVAGTGTCNVTVADSSNILGPNGSVASLPIGAIGTTFVFRVLGGILTAS